MKEMLPIISRDGKEIKLGDKCYFVEMKDITSYREKGLRTKTGVVRSYIETEEVIRINLHAHTRSFVTRSSHGCESYHTVRNSCLPKNMFFKKDQALRYKKELDQQDMGRIDEKIQELESYIVDSKKKIKTWKDCKSKLKTNSLKEAKT